MPYNPVDFPYIDDFCDDEVFVFSTIGQGPSGEVGNPGPQGEKGDPGKDGILSFDTVADMQAAIDLEVGMTVHTNGFHTPEDGGAAYYMVNKDSSGIDGFTVFAGQNGLYFHLLDIAINGYIDIRWTGAYGDYDGSSTYTDNAPYFEKAFEYIAANPSIPIKIVGRYGVATQIDARYALQMFGEYRPSRELIESTDYDLKPVSEIYVANGITAFSLDGSGQSRAFSFINLDNIKFTSSERTSTLIDAPTFGAPSRPNWIRGCEASGFANILKSIGNVSQYAWGTTHFNFDISDCNFYANSYVVYTDSSDASQATIGNLYINNSVLEQGGGQLYINNSFGAISIVNALIEGNSGTMRLHGTAADFMLMSSYFEKNNLTIEIIGNDLALSSCIIANNTFAAENSVINVAVANGCILDRSNYGMEIHSLYDMQYATASFLRRVTGGDVEIKSDSATIKAIYGNTLVWNQLNDNGGSTTTYQGITATNNGDGSWTLNGIATGKGSISFSSLFNIIVGHRYLVTGCPSGGSVNTYYFGAGGIAIDIGNGGIWKNPQYQQITLRLDYFSGVTFDNVLVYPQIFDLTKMFGDGNEPITVTDFKKQCPLTYYPHDNGSMLSVNVDGIKSVGFNWWNEEWELGNINVANGQSVASTTRIRSKGYIEVIPDESYYFNAPEWTNFTVLFYDADKQYPHTEQDVGWVNLQTREVVTIPDWCKYVRFYVNGTTYSNNICINLSSSRNGEYEPYQGSECLIPMSDYFPSGMKSVGVTRDELTTTQVIQRIGTRDYRSGDESDSMVITDGTTTCYVLATPVITNINSSMFLAYKVEQGGTEYIATPTGEQSTPPVLSIAYGDTQESAVFDSLSVVASPDGPIAQRSYTVGSYLTMNGKLWKTTTNIAVGDVIVSGTNVTETTVMTELLVLTA